MTIKTMFANQRFGRIIHDLRKAAHLTQPELAERVGVTFTYISKIENGKLDVLPSESLIKRLADVLGADEYELRVTIGKLDTQKLQDAAQSSTEMARLLIAIQNGEVSRVMAMNILDRLAANPKKGKR